MVDPIRRALISVSDKTGLLDFGKALSALGVEIISTGGSARTLHEAGIPVIEVSDFTGFPEIMDGRVKTLQPKIKIQSNWNNYEDFHDKEYNSEKIKKINEFVAVKSSLSKIVDLGSNFTTKSIKTIN